MQCSGRYHRASRKGTTAIISHYITKDQHLFPSPPRGVSVFRLSSSAAGAWHDGTHLSHSYASVSSFVVLSEGRIPSSNILSPDSVAIITACM